MNTIKITLENHFLLGLLNYESLCHRRLNQPTIPVNCARVSNFIGPSEKITVLRFGLALFVIDNVSCVPSTDGNF